MKRLFVILLCVALVLGCAACSSPAADTAKSEGTSSGDAATAPASTESAAASTSAGTSNGGTFKVGIVVAEYNEWNHLYYAEIEKKCEEYGWESEVFDAAQDVNQQINLVNSCVSQGFNAITIQPADNAALAPALIKAADSGVIVVSHYDYDKDSDVGKKIYQVLFGQKDSGILEAQTYVDMAGDSGEVALIGGLTGADNARLRSEGMREVFAKYPNIKIVSEVFCDWDRQKAMAAAQDIITANPNLNAFLVQDDGMSWGVYEAIEAAGKTDQVKIASQGFYESSIPAIKEGKFMFSISYPASFFARDAMDLIKKIADGETVERVNVLGMELVTTENADTAPHD
jgi:ABC-type sugar transport system substrate-binding protein